MRLSRRQYLRLPKSAAPPDLSVAEAVFLVYGEIGPAATGATLLELAQLGVVRIDESEAERGPQTVVLVEPELAVEEHHRVLLKGMFPTLEPGDQRTLRRGRKDNARMLGAHDRFRRAVADRLSEREWYYRLPVSGRKGTLLRRTRILGWGVLTPAGHTRVNDVLSFRRYFATLEPGELRRAELVSLLPWAFALELDRRWEQLASGQATDDDEPVIRWSATGIFRLGPFRQGLAAFANAATYKAMQDTKYWYGADGTADDGPAAFDSGQDFGPDFGGSSDNN